MPKDASWIGLADAVAAVRAELATAAAVGAQGDVHFTVGAVEIEFVLALTREAGGSAGVTAWVLSADAKAGRVRRGSQRVRVTLNAETAAGAPLRIHDDDSALVPRPNRIEVEQ